MTPESSEQPRETRDGTPLGHYENRVAGNDFSAVESVWFDDSPEVTPERFDRVLKDQRAKVSSPELASLAAKYLDVTGTDIQVMSRQGIENFAATVRSLAASVLAQAEGNPRK